MFVHAGKVLSLQNSSRWEFDFSDMLLFPGLLAPGAVVYSVQSDEREFFQHLARPTANGTTVVVVETSTSVSAEVTVEVSQAL